jgi:hypothetical protein
MISKWQALLCLGLLIAAAGCGTQPGTSASGAADTAGTKQHAEPPQGEGHAVAGVVPGSYEDWCAEHAVPESQCTRCDASLIPAFQAANDWCPDHGLPMSQCTIHDPNLKIVRPPKPEGK